MDFDYGHMCRLCASTDQENMNDIFEDIPGDINVVDLVKKYLDIVICNDGICPLMICGQCVEILNNFNSYAKKCEDVQEVFLKLYKNSKEKLDYNESYPSPGLQPDVKIDIKVKPEIKSDSEHEYDNVQCPMSDDEALIEKVIKRKSKYQKAQHETYLRQSRKTKQKRYKDDIEGDSDSEDSKRKKVLKHQYFVKFECNDCPKAFVNWYRLKAHTLKEHRKPASVKCICGVTVKSRTAIYRHIAYHKDPTSFKCNLCPRVTKTAGAFERHRLRHIPKADLVFTCDNCLKKFPNKDALKSHMNVHMPRELRYIFPCKTCDKMFTHSSAALNHHRVVHEKVKRFVCDLCGFTCGTSSELSQHRAIHSDEKRFMCPVCSKSFKTSSNLRTHTDIHDATSYPCPHCSKILNSRRTFRKHLLVHDNLCRHVCCFCNKAFKRRQTLKAHLNTHTGENPVQCPWCPMKFRYSSSCRSHKQRAHPDKLHALDCQDETNKGVTSGHVHNQEQKVQLLCSETTVQRDEAIQCDRCLITFLNITAYDSHKDICHFNNTLFAKHDNNLSDRLEVVAIQPIDNLVKIEMGCFQPIYKSEDS